MRILFVVLSVFACFILNTVVGVDNAVLVVLSSGELVKMVDNCTVGDRSTCPALQCCTKKILSYSSTYTGPKPTHEFKCSPLRQTGEFCYLSTPENYCPCINRCHTNGFFGACL